MIFNSIEFFFFAPVFFLLWRWAAPRKRARWILITVASFIFYGWWDWRYTFLLAGTGLVDFYAALGMVRWPQRRRLLLWTSIVSNIGVLGFFKYWGLFARTINSFSAYLGGTPHVSLLDVILPVGISFYTFESLSYTIDVYRGTFVPTRDLWHFFAFLSFFARLVAGPIVRARDLLPQLESWYRPDESKLWDGLRLVISGYFKKLVIADNIGPAIHLAVGTPVARESAAYWWMFAFLFTVRIYSDFAGYSDIGRGIAKWMGYEFPLNFNHPLSLSSSVTDFWNRWHMTLSFWFRDYVYQPLGGTSRKLYRSLKNLWITMGLIGLWHGAAWTFVLFGFSNAFLMSIERIVNWPKFIRRRLPSGKAIMSILVFIETSATSVWFAAPSLKWGWDAFRRMLFPRTLDLSSIAAFGRIPLIVFVVAVVIEWINCYVLTPEMRQSRLFAAAEPIALSVLVVASVFLRGPGDDFIYFQF